MTRLTGVRPADDLSWKDLRYWKCLNLKSKIVFIHTQHTSPNVPFTGPLLKANKLCLTNIRDMCITPVWYSTKQNYAHLAQVSLLR